VYAESAEDLFFAQGYVHARIALWQMEFQRRIGHGRLAEILGEPALETDRFLRTIGVSRAAEADLAALDVTTRSYLEAYAMGVNAYVAAHADRLPVEFRLLGFDPGAVAAAGLLSVGQDDGVGPGRQLGRGAPAGGDLPETRPGACCRKLLPPYPQPVLLSCRRRRSGQAPVFVPDIGRGMGHVWTLSAPSCPTVTACLLPLLGLGDGPQGWELSLAAPI